MKSLRSRQINPNNSPQTLITPNTKPQSSSPSTPSRTLEPQPSSMSSLSSPSTPDSASGGTNPRRSRRLALKLGIPSEEETQGKTPISSENVHFSFEKSNETRVYSSGSKKGGVFEKGSVEEDGINPRRSSRIATKLTIGENSDSVGFESEEKKRKSWSLGSKSKKARVLNSVNEKGSIDEKRLFDFGEDDLSLEIDGEKDSGSNTDSGEGKSRNGKNFIFVDELESKETLDRTISSKFGSSMGSGSSKRRSGRLAVNAMEGVKSGSNHGGISLTEDINHHSSAIENVGGPLIFNVSEGVEDDREGKVRLAAESGGDKDLEIYELKPMVVADEEKSVGTSRRRSGRLAVNVTKVVGLGSNNLPSEARIGKRKLQETNIDSDETKNAGDRESEPKFADETGEHDDPEIYEVDPVTVADEHKLILGKRRYSPEEKGKGKFDLNLKPEEQPELELDTDPAVSAVPDDVAPGIIQSLKHVDSGHAKQTVRMRVSSQSAGRRERFRDIARRRASHFANFQAEEEEANITAPTSADSGDAAQEIEDWPGPFSTAMKIIRDRTMKRNVQMDSTQDVSNTAPVINWMPSKERVQKRVKPFAPSLQDLCLDILSKNSDSIVSLKYVPNELRNKLTQMLCDSRKMDSRFLGLLITEPPEMVRVKECSWISEEQMVEAFGKCDTSKLSVLQLDLCGRCMPDYVLRTTLARSPNCLPALVALSLKGACRVTDAGMRSLVASAPFLRSINLGQCSLVTFNSINTIADRLGLLLRELYLDDCQSLDAMLMLPALKKLKCLEVLSVADMQTVCDDFVNQFVTQCNSNMKVLGLANCEKLTDVSVKAIAEKFSGLCALDLTNLRKLTDFSIGHVSNGCPSIQKLMLCRNASTDEAIAAFLEASGGSLVDLSLNNVKNVGPHTAISLARRCTRNLLSLDLSWCRNLTDEAVGHIVDGCSALRLLKLFGCTQITNKFLHGHSNPLVQIVGLKMSPILEHLNIFDPQEGPFRYSSVTLS